MKILISLILAANFAWAQTPSFEVASIKPATFGGGRGRGGFGGPKIDGARVDIPFIALANLLPYAFRVKDYQVTAPTWAQESFWAISATIPKGVSTDQAPEMMQSLLAERFQLVFHREMRERPTYTLTVAEGGSKLAEASPENYQAWDGSFPGFSFRGPLQAGAPITGRIVPMKNCSRRYEFVPLPMAAFADALTIFLARPVVDQTGMEGKYRVILEVPPEAEAGMMTNLMRGRGLPPSPAGGGGRRGPGGGDGAPPPPEMVMPGCQDPISLIAEGVGEPDSAITKAVQQLGLRLQQGKAPIETIIVDHLGKTPTEN